MRMRSAVGIVLVVLAGVVSAAARASSALSAAALPIAASASPNGSENHTLTKDDLEAFLDGLVPYALKRNDVAGGVVAVVKDGQLLFAKGYGYADIANRKPVVADETLFRPGSISKLFTWTSVMQLVGEGKIDLDRDINDYLDFKIPPQFGKPITMRNLMTHTGGFEEANANLTWKKTTQPVSLELYLKSHIPARIFAPGKIVAYSNYGAGLAGYIVQRVSGEPYNQYVEEHIFHPLSMTHSTFVQPLPPALAPNMSMGYMLASSRKAVHFELLQGPVGGLSATATDIARFMIAHLQDGRYGNEAILTPAMAKLMHSTQSRMAPGFNGFDLGFYQVNSNGLRVISHGGNTDLFHSGLYLLLDKNIGLFVSFNSTGANSEGNNMSGEVFHAFLNRYFPYTAADEPTVAYAKEDAARVAGWYEASRRLNSSLRLLSAFDQSSVTAHPDGTIEIGSLPDNLASMPRHWREVGPLVYRDVGGDTHLEFVTNAQGDIAYWVSDSVQPIEVFQRVHGLRQLSILRELGGASIAVWLLTFVVWCGGFLVRRHFGRTLELSPGAAGLRLASRLGVIALLAMLAVYFEMGQHLSDFPAVADPWLLAGYVLGVLGLVGALAVLVEAIARTLRGPGGFLVRVGETVLGVSALYAIWGIFAYGLVNFSFIY